MHQRPRHVAPAKASERRGGKGRGRGEERDRRVVVLAGSGESNLYFIIGGSALLLAAVIAIAVWGSGDDGAGEDVERLLSKRLLQVNEAQKAGDDAKALDLLEKILADKRFKASPRRRDCDAAAQNLRARLNSERDGAAKVAEFRRKLQAAKDDNTAMRRAEEFWKECLALQSLYGSTAAGPELRAIKEDLQRWRATESQGDWQQDYNRTKQRIERDCLASGNFSQAVREWKQFGELFHDPLVHSRLETELLNVNKQARAAAETLAAEVALRGATREELEAALPKFNGTDGQEIISQKLRSMQ